MHVTVGAVSLPDLNGFDPSESSSSIRFRVGLARARQLQRFEKMRGVSCNAHAPGRWIDANAGIAPDSRSLLHAAATSLSLSARGYHRMLKVARTIADLDESATVGPSHVAEALRFRPIARSA
jgi:magnesium chelatase family protein